MEAMCNYQHHLTKNVIYRNAYSFKIKYYYWSKAIRTVNIPEAMQVYYKSHKTPIASLSKDRLEAK